MTSRNLYIGAMSGTSADSIDVVLVDFEGASPHILAHHETPLDPILQAEVVALSSGAKDSLEAALVLDRQLAFAFADAVKGLLSSAGVRPDQVKAIGSHGQTLRHQTYAAAHDTHRFSCQIGDPNTIAELTGIDVVADFRRRDLAAGGEAAPLAPGFHYHYFSHTQIVRAVVNIGGFSNATLLCPGQLPLGFDTGPGNCLMDGWCERHTHERFDRDGQWAASGRILGDLLAKLKTHDFFQRPIPKSTGRESFNLAWLDALLPQPLADPADVQSTLMQLTVETLLESLRHAQMPVEEIYICGGGAQNKELMARLGAATGIRVETTATLGVDPKLVEGCAFAWMAKQTLASQPSNLASVTGARGPRILGGIYRA